MARTYGIETPLARKNVRSTLQAIFKHNFKVDLSEHANAQRRLDPISSRHPCA